MAKKSFLQGAVILGIAGIIIKVLGAFFRIPLANLIGDEGMGYYQTAYPIYVLFLTLATAGIPVAISRMVSERVAIGNHLGAHKVFRVSFIMLFAVGISSAAICFFGADFLISLLASDQGGADKARFAMMAIAPALLFVPLMASYRGYFQGMQNMKPTAMSQVVEQFFRVFVGLALAYVLVKFGTEYAAAGASFGATAGAIAGLIAMVWVYLYKRKSIKREVTSRGGNDNERTKDILMKMFTIAVPITIGAAIMPIMNTIDLAIVIRRLTDVGWTYEAANSVYGQLTGMAAPLINFPQVLTQAVAMSLVPAVAAAFRQKDTAFLHENIQLGLRTAIIIGFPCGFGLMILAEPIMLLLYPMQRASAISAAPCLFIMAFGVIFLSMGQTLTGILQGMGKQNIPVRNIMIGAAFKIAATYYLTGIESINVKGAAVGTVLAYFVATVLNMMAVRKYTDVKFDVKITFVKPGMAIIVMIACAWLLYNGLFTFLGNALSVMISIMVAAVVYGVMLLKTKAITRQEIERLPRGKSISKILAKFIK